jgi:hypothetical protein
MKIKEFIAVIQNVPFNVEFIPDGVIKFKQLSKPADEFTHSIGFLTKQQHGGILGFGYESGYEIIIEKKSPQGNSMAKYTFENISDVDVNLLNIEIKKIASINLTIRTNTTGSISYSNAEIIIEI